MSWWTNLFVSRHVLFLESELKKQHELHQSELAYQRELNQELREEAQRLRLFLHPGLQRVELHPDTTPASADPDMKQAPGGTPFQRIQAREMEADRIRYELKMEQKKRDQESGKTAPKEPN